MEDIKYVNLIEISPVVIEVRGAENGELVVPVNNTLVSHTAFLAAVSLIFSNHRRYTSPYLFSKTRIRVFKV